MSRLKLEQNGINFVICLFDFRGNLEDHMRDEKAQK